jgi:hypothetical protein
VQKTDQIPRTETGNAGMLEHSHRRTGSPLPQDRTLLSPEEGLARNLDIPTFQQATTKWQVLIVDATASSELATEFQESS